MSSDVWKNSASQGRTTTVAATRPARSKYGNRRVTYDGISFASKKECARYGELKLLERAGEIEQLTLQPRFPLRVNGKLVCTYVADFSYLPVYLGERMDRVIVEDVKGHKTDVYRIKSKLFEALHGFPIREV